MDMFDSNDVMIGGGGGVGGGGVGGGGVGGVGGIATGMDEPTHRPKFTAT